MLCSSEIVSQTTSEITYPTDLNGIIKLDISTYINCDKEISDNNLLAVFVKNETREYASHAIQGKYTKEDNYLVFKPYFPFERGMNYIVRTQNTNANDQYLYQSFQIGKTSIVKKAEVISIYPSANQLPENLLRFYIYFNTPMQKGQALKYIQLIDEEGNIDRHAFMEFKQELWSTDGKRLTILFDPGRIKRGVSTNVLRGPALLEGKKYKLRISGVWQDVYGQPLSINTTKEFVVAHDYRQQMKINNWEIDVPKANSNDTLTIKFDRIIDHALIQSMITLEHKEDNPIGHWEILGNEQSLQFIPQRKWLEGDYRIVIDSRLEDIVGNNLQNLLDHNKTDQESKSQAYHFIEFKL